MYLYVQIYIMYVCTCMYAHRFMKFYVDFISFLPSPTHLPINLAYLLARLSHSITASVIADVYVLTCIAFIHTWYMRKWYQSVIGVHRQLSGSEGPVRLRPPAAAPFPARSPCEVETHACMFVCMYVGAYSLTNVTCLPG